MKNKFLIPILLGIHTISPAYKSQFGQDKYLNDNFFKNKKNGLFIDIGAHDGVSSSNTFFFEKELNWTGICFEPLPEVFKKLEKSRNCTCINACISDSEEKIQFIEVKGYPEMLSGMVATYDPKHFSRLEREIAAYGGSYQIITVQSYKLNDILNQYDIKEIDYLSLDTEGSEFIILKSIDFDLLYIHAISVESNYGTSQIKEFLEDKGFQFVTKLTVDEIYINKKSLS